MVAVDRTRVERPRRNGNDVRGARERDGDGCRRRLDIWVAQLTEVVAAPALHRAARAQRAREELAGVDLHGVGDADDVLRRLEKAYADVAGFAARRAASEAKGLKRGIGYSSYIEACGIAPSNIAGALGARAGLFECDCAHRLNHDPLRLPTHVWRAGGGFGGAAIALVPKSETEAISAAVIAEFSAHGFDSPNTFTVTASDGAKRD